MICILSFFFTSFSYGKTDKKVVLIAINETNFDDWYSMHSIKEIIENGSIGLMNTRSSKGANVYKAYTTIGSGTRAEASALSTRSFELKEEDIKEIYFRRTGITKNNDEGIVNIDIAALNKLNLEGEYGAVPGTLGQKLHDHGFKTAVIGNADTDDTKTRLGTMIAMDHDGYVDYGNIGMDALIEDKDYPFGFKSNYPKLIDSFKEAYQKTEFITVDIGDISRLERYKENLTDEMYQVHKKKILKDIDDFIQSLLKQIDVDHTMVIVVSPYPSSEDIKSGNKLTPLVLYGDNVKEKTVLTSDTTRRVGIVGNVDIAPSILEYLDLDTQGMNGKPLCSVSVQHPFDYITELNSKTVSTSNNRYPVLYTYATFQIFISLFALVVILLKEKLNKKFIAYFRNILLSTMIIPFILLIFPLLKIYNIVVTYLTIIALIIIISWLVKKLRKETLDNILLISAITTIALLIDIATGCNLIKNSLLGYDPIIGARYYGVGNEYMGVLIASTLVFTTAMIDRFHIRPIWAVAIFIVTTAIIGYPNWGANVGGTITAVAAFTFVSLRLFKVKIKMKQWIVIGILVFCIVAFMAFIDIYLLQSQSHLANAIQQIKEDGFAAILMIIQRKISMNMMLIGITIWSKVLLSAIVILAILFYRPVGTIYTLSRIHPNLSMGWSGIVVTCIVGFLVNDSGIVAAGTAIIFLITPMLYQILLMPNVKEKE